MRKRAKLAKKLTKLIKVEVIPHLSGRQKQIVKLFFLKGLTESEIAETLGIAQSTVNQHLFGKKRNDRKIGGSIQKIRKTILKKSSAQEVLQSEYLDLCQKLLDTRISMRDKFSLLKTFEK